MIDQNIYSKDVNFQGSKGLVFVGDRILVYRRDNKTNNFPLMIDLPGGGRENDESPFETFKREVKEEFGIDIMEDDIVFSKKYPAVVDPAKEMYFIVTRPLGIKESDILFGSEGTEFLLIAPQDFLNLDDAIERHKIKVADYLKIIG